MKRSESASGYAERAMSKRIPERMCSVCRCIKPRDQMFRLVKLKDDAKFVPNPSGLLPGKGMYLCRIGDCVQRMQKERRLRRQLLEKLQPDAMEWMQGSRESEQ